MAAEKNYFMELNNVNVNEHTEKKNGLTYLSWAWAWAEVKKQHPDAIYTIYENVHGWNYHTDGRTCWVKTGVTISGIEHIEYLPVMDFRNDSIPAGKVTSFDVNKAIQRSLTKAAARHGLGLYIYAGEDLPEEYKKPEPKKEEKPKYITDEQLDELIDLTHDAGMELKQMLAAAGIKDERQISQEIFPKLIKALKIRIEKNMQGIK